MTQQTFSKQQKRTRKDLMDATIKLIILHGYDKLTVSAICHEANYSRRAFYKYFRNYDDIVGTILAEWFMSTHNELMASMENLMSPEGMYRHWCSGVLVLHKNIIFLRQLPDLMHHDVGKPLRKIMQRVIFDNLNNNEVRMRDGIKPELLINMEINMTYMTTEQLKKTGELDDAIAIIDDHFRLLFNQEPPKLDILHLYNRLQFES